MPLAKSPTRPKPEPIGDDTVRRTEGESQLDAGDISLIRSMLDRTPTERLERLQDFADGVMMLRDGRIRRE